LIGKRVDEAADLLSVFIDQAIVDGQLQVEIVHGHGTGRLRQGIHEVLKTLPYVSNFSHPDAAAGGAAITIVELVQR
jgi:DNA mismatch repair protein MutS2